MTRFSDFNEALLANAKRVDTKRKEDDILDKLASQLVVLKERQQIKQQIDYAFNRRTAEIAQERRIKKGIDERSQKRKQEKLEDDKDRGQANGALSNYKLRKGNLINLLDGIESAAVDAINRDPRNLDPYIKVMQEMEEKLEGIDAYVTPSFGQNNLGLTNLTGHPAVVLPNGFRSSDGTPTSINFIGRLFGETEVLALAHAYQQATDFHLKRPPVERFLGELEKSGT